MTITTTQVGNSFWVSGSTQQLTYYNSLTKNLPEVPIQISSSAPNFQIRVTPVSPSQDLQFRRTDGTPVNVNSPIVLGPQSKSIVIASIDSTGYDNLQVSSTKTFNIAFNLIALQTASIPTSTTTDNESQKFVNGATCTSNNQCLSEYCNLFVGLESGLGVCTDAPELKKDGAPCIANTECESGICRGSNPAVLNSGTCGSTQP